MSSNIYNNKTKHLLNHLLRIWDAISFMQIKNDEFNINICCKVSHCIDIMSYDKEGLPDNLNNIMYHFLCNNNKNVIQLTDTFQTIINIDILSIDLSKIIISSDSLGSLHDQEIENVLYLIENLYSLNSNLNQNNLESDDNIIELKGLKINKKNIIGTFYYETNEFLLNNLKLIKSKIDTSYYNIEIY